MKRRRFLTTAGVAVTVPALAGCLGDDDEGDGEGEPTDDGGSTELDEDQIQAQFDDAIDNLVQNADKLDDLSDPGVERTSSDLSQLRTRFQVASDSLDAIESDASGEMTDQIADARTILAFHETLIEAHSLGYETNQVVADAGGLADSGQYEEAVEAYDEAVSLFQEQQALMNELEAVYVTVETDAFDEPALDYSDELVTHLRIDDPDEIEASEAWLMAQREWNQAFYHVEVGLNEWDREEWTTAREAFTSAQDPLQRAIDQTRAVREYEAIPTELQQAAAGLEGVIETQEEAFALFVQGAEAAEAGDLEEATELHQQAFQILEEP